MARRIKIQKIDYNFEEKIEKILNTNLNSLDTYLKISDNNFSMKEHENFKLKTNKNKNKDEKISSEKIENLTKKINLSMLDVKTTTQDSGFFQKKLKILNKKDQLSDVSLEDFNSKNTKILINHNNSSEKKKMKKKNHYHFFQKFLFWIAIIFALIVCMSGSYILYQFFLKQNQYINFDKSLFNYQNFFVTLIIISPMIFLFGFFQLKKISKILQESLKNIMEIKGELSPENLESNFSKLNDKIYELNNHFERTISQASSLDALLQNEINNLDQVYHKKEIQIRNLIVDLSRERELIEVHLGDTKKSVINFINHLKKEFLLISDYMNSETEFLTKKLSKTLNINWKNFFKDFNFQGREIEKKISEKFNEALKNLDFSKNVIMDDINELFKKIDQKNKETNNKFSNCFNETIDNLIESFQKNIENFIKNCNEQIHNFENKNTAISKSVKNNIEEIRQLSDIIEFKIETTTKKIFQDFKKKLSVLDYSLINRCSQSVIEFDKQIVFFENKANNLNINFENIKNNSIKKFDQYLEEIITRYNSLRKEIDDRGLDLSKNFENTLERISNLSDFIDKKINSSSNQFCDKIENEFNKIDMFFEEKNQFLLKNFSKNSEEIAKNTNNFIFRLQEETNNINSLLREQKKGIIETISRENQNIILIIKEIQIRLSHAVEVIEETIGRIIEEKSSIFINQFVNECEKFSENIEKETKNIINKIQKNCQNFSNDQLEISKRLLSNISNLEEKNHQYLEIFARNAVSLQETVNSASKSIDAQSKNIDLYINSLTETFKIGDIAIEKTFNEKTKIIEEKIINIQSVLNLGNSSLINNIHQCIKDLKNYIKYNEISLRKTCSNYIKEFEKQKNCIQGITSSSQISLKEILDSNINIIQTLLENNKTEIDSFLSKNSKEVFEKNINFQDNIKKSFLIFEEKLNSQQKIVDKNIYNFLDSIDSKNTNIENSFVKQISILDERTNSIERILQDNFENFFDIFEKKIFFLSEKTKEHISKIELFFCEIKNSWIIELDKTEKHILSEKNNFSELISCSIKNLDEIFSNQIFSLEKRTQEISHQIQNATKNIENIYLISTENFKENVLNKSIILNEDFNKISDNLGKQINVFGKISQEISQEISSQKKNFQILIKDLKKLSSLIFHSIDEKNKKFHLSLKSLILSNENTLNTSGEKFFQNFSKNTEQVLSNFKNTTSKIEFYYKKICEKIDTTNNSMDLSMVKFTNNISLSDDKISNLISKIDDRIEKFSEKLNSNIDLIKETKNVFDDSNNYVVDTFESHGKSLNKLSKDISNKSKTIFNVMKNHEHIILSITKNIKNNILNLKINIEESLSSTLEEIFNKLKNTTSEIYFSTEKIKKEIENANLVLRKDINLFPIEQTKKYTEILQKEFLQQVNVIKDFYNLLNESHDIFNISKINQRKKEKELSPLTFNLIEDHNIKNFEKEKNILYELLKNISHIMRNDEFIKIWKNYHKNHHKISIDRLYTENGYKIYKKAKNMYSTNVFFKKIVIQYIKHFEYTLENIKNNSSDKKRIWKYLISDIGKVYVMLSHISNHIK